MFYLKIGLATLVWCAFHSLFVTHAWRDFLRRQMPKYHTLGRLLYVVSSSLTLLFLMRWIKQQPETILWSWHSGWVWVRWSGLALSGVLFVLGAKSFDVRAFAGLRQCAALMRGVVYQVPPFKMGGILSKIRHPWYSGTILFLFFCFPFSDTNLIWRSIFVAYVFLGTELEDRKLLSEFGNDYENYRSKVPRFIPWR